MEGLKKGKLEGRGAKGGGGGGAERAKKGSWNEAVGYGVSDRERR